MQGYVVERRFGWDTHGLPVEYEIDKKLGIKSRQDVLDMGIGKCAKIPLLFRPPVPDACGPLNLAPYPLAAYVSLFPPPPCSPHTPAV